MLKVPMPEIDTSTKCGIIYYSLPSIFEIFCTECEEKILFNDFLEHFRKEHLFNNETIIGVGPLKTSTARAATVKLEAFSEDDNDNNNNNEENYNSFDRMDRRNTSDMNDDSDLSSSFFEFDYTDSIDEQELLLYEEDQEYIDSIEHIGYLEHIDQEGISSGMDDMNGETRNGEDFDDSNRPFDNTNGNLDTMDDSWSDSNFNEESNQYYSDEGGFEYVLFEEEFQPNRVVEEFEPESEANKNDENNEKKETLPKPRKKRRPVKIAVHPTPSEENSANATEGAEKSTEANQVPEAEDEPNAKGEAPERKKKVYECHICHHILESKFNLKYHIEHVHGSKGRKYQCKHCSRCLTTSFQLIVHKRKSHPELYNKPVAPKVEVDDVEKRPVPCPLCFRRFRNGSSLSTHMRIHNVTRTDDKSLMDKTMTCNICGKVARSPKFYYVHMLRMHGTTFCDICNMNFDTPADCYHHKINHKTEKKFKCEFCDTACFTAKGLERHMQTHKELTYEERNLSFEKTANLPEKSLDANQYVCEICGLTLRNITILKAHMMRHRGERPFSCDICGKAFYNRGTLKNHKTIHSGERPYFCTDCGATFQYKRALKTHMILHSNKRDYKCSYCDKAYVEAARLRYHIRLKHGCSLNDNLPEFKKSTTLINASKSRAKPPTPVDNELEMATKSLEEIVRDSE